MSAYEKLAGLIVERGATPIAGRIEQPAGPAYTTRLVVTPELGGLDLVDLHEANIARQAEWCPEQVPDLSFRGNELAGETGEACNVIKKLERERHGWRGSRETVAHLAEELADVVICADLCAITAGVDLASAVRAKFNATSEKQGLSVFLRTTAPALPVDAGEGRATLEQFLRGRIDQLLQENASLCERVRSSAPQPPGVSPAPDALAALKDARSGLKTARDTMREAISRCQIHVRGGLDEGEEKRSFRLALFNVLDIPLAEVACRLHSVERAIAQAETVEAGASERGDCPVCGLSHLACRHEQAIPSPEPSRHGVEAMRDVAAERERQRTVEGWTPEHDDTHNQGEMALAAAHYAIVSVAQALPAPSPEHPSQKFWLHQHADAVWPWDIVWRKPKDRRRNLVRAGALIVAEIERLDRAALAQHQGPGQASGGA